MATLKQIAANRLNAARSTGPKSAAGKNKSKRNASKHGLTGTGAALDDAQRAELQAEIDQFNRVLKPQDHVEMRCVERMALATVRSLRINAEAESRTARRRRAAVRRWDTRREAVVARHAAALMRDPAGTVAALRTTAEGCDWLADQWQELLPALEAGGPPDAKQMDRAVTLLGLVTRPTIHDDPYLAGFVLELLAASEPTPRGLLNTFFRGLSPEDAAELTPPPAEARAALLAPVRAHVEELTGLGDRLWAEQDGPDRAAAADCALMDKGAVGVRLGKYAAAASLEYQRAQKSLEAARKERRALAGEGLPPWGWGGVAQNEPNSGTQVEDREPAYVEPPWSPRRESSPPTPPPVAFGVPQSARPTLDSSTEANATRPYPPPTPR
jgi:hypothetical protein